MQADPTSSVANVWVTWHDAGHVTNLPGSFSVRAGQRSYVELLRGRRASLGTRLYTYIQQLH